MTTTYIALAQTTLSTTTTSVTFSSIPQTYRDLVLVVSSRSGTNIEGFVTMRFNGNTSNYSRVEMLGNGSSASSFAASNLIPITYTSEQGTHIAQIMDYSATDKHKTVLYRNNATNSSALAGAGRWGDTAAITTVALISFSQNFAAGSTFSLYGVN